MASFFDEKPAQRLERMGGWCNVWTPGPALLVTRAYGYLHHDYARAIIDVLESMQHNGFGLRQFHDWYDVDHFDIRCQADLTAWHARHLRVLDRLEILCRSNLVRMGVSVANVPLRGLIRLHERPEDFRIEAVRASTIPPRPSVRVPSR